MLEPPKYGVQPKASTVRKLARAAKSFLKDDLKDSTAYTTR